MKFLLELVVPCFGSNQLHNSTTTADNSVSDETQSLMKRRRRLRKRGRVAGRTGHVAEWRPSLSVISEHKPAITEKNGEERKVRRKSKGGDFGRNAFEAVVPAFSPTPFMF
ncbi:unnamed protein product [Cochlearia groenlandica]